MNDMERGEPNAEVVQEMRALATRGAEVPEIVEFLLGRLGLDDRKALFPTLVYFVTAFGISLREALPLREWLSGKDRSEVDSILIPAMRAAKERWQLGELQRV